MQELVRRGSGLKTFHNFARVGKVIGRYRAACEGVPREKEPRSCVCVSVCESPSFSSPHTSP